VPPAELEDALLQFPDVAEAAVCATWDENQETEIPVGYVNFKPSVRPEDRDQKLKEVKAFADGRLASYKKLRGGVHYLEVIPRNPTGKLLRRQLPARIEMERRAAAAKRKGKL
jgi:acyl-coenzyme A synthetase/AMP-(fatty) acid ligase